MQPDEAVSIPSYLLLAILCFVLILGLAIVLFACCPLHCWAQFQQVGSLVEPLSDTRPFSAPEERRRSTINPDAAASKLASGDLKLVGETLAELDLALVVGAQPNDVRLGAVNLDSSSDLERVLTVKSNSGAAALIYKWEDSEWWELGRFYSGGPLARVIEPLVELRETVWIGTKDLVVRQGGAQGSGVGEISLSIYRVFSGRLYRVLDVLEASYNSGGDESNRIEYPDLEYSLTQRDIVVRQSKQLRGRRTSSCVQYRWNSAQFRFLKRLEGRRACGETN